MYKQNTSENAANRFSYVGEVYTIGERKAKEDTLNSLPKGWADLHRSGAIHIHDLDAYGRTYNCLTIDFSWVKQEEYKGISDVDKITMLFNKTKLLLTKLGNEQSGGMAFANFDCDLANLLDEIGYQDSEANNQLLIANIKELIRWCNENHTRMGQTSYYITFNIGLADSERSKFVARTVIYSFENMGDKVFKPNIVFKVKKGINKNVEDRNHDLLLMALECTSKKMIPTYLLCDCKEDEKCDPKLLSIMGCRTRVYDNVYKKHGALGRGNIDNISINLPRIALEIHKEYFSASFDEKLDTFKKRWRDLGTLVKDILIDRYEKLLKRTPDEFPTNLENRLWCEDFKDKSVEEVFKHGTLSIGFIGLSEAFEVLSGHKFYSEPNLYISTLGFVKYMRDYCDFLKTETKLNFSLLATSGELISGRFIEYDKKLFQPKVDIFAKGFYTNSFHIDVDSGLPGYKKIQLEGLFHEYCNGGSITYIELGEAPIGNAEGLEEYINIAVNSGVHYLGFNFPKDICDECGNGGIFDICPECGSKKITRIRRVSGYLEILDGFTTGKKNEEKERRSN